MAVFPRLKPAMTASGVFDFDGAVFRTLWGANNTQQVIFRNYVRYYLSEHRPLRALLDARSRGEESHVAHAMSRAATWHPDAGRS